MAEFGITLPEWAVARLSLWDRLKVEKKKEIPETPIKITLPDGKVVDGTAGKTSPMDVAQGISSALAQKTVVADVNGVAWDALRPLEADCELVLHTFDSEKGKKTFWHSSAHVLGEALELKYGCHLTIGPPLDEGGFYYDLALPEGGESKVISDSDFPAIKELVNKIIKQKQGFERMELTKAEALEMFGYNKYKKAIITDKIPENGSVTAYRCGPLVDLCRGPHIPHTARIKAFEITKNSSAYWLGKAENDSLQRVYGISFPDTAKMKEWKKFQEEAKKRDHRLIGQKQELFFMDIVSPGCVFFLPHGTRIYNKLIELLRGEYRNRGFQEVISPNIFNTKLWETSGHWQNYAENMFSFEVEKQMYALKPMNCPGHCVIFQHRVRSYRELPLRLADFGVLHRNELSGTLTGLTRVRRFQQDDAHIFCRSDQIMEEIINAMKFMEHVYGLFGFKFDLELSTRPEKYLGEIEVWNNAEAMMQQALEQSGHKWKLNPGDGAFYGPKIDIHITDALNRSFQCATIQLDFQLPQRFKLEYQSESTESVDRPVIIHRAIYGSLERFFAILTEHLAGDWPFWLSPRQFLVIPITDQFDSYAEAVRQRLHTAGFYADVDVSHGRTFKKKVAVAASGFHNYIFIVGAQEQTDDSVNIRVGNAQLGAKKVEEVIRDAVEAQRTFKTNIWEVAPAAAAEASSSKGKAEDADAE